MNSFLNIVVTNLALVLIMQGESEEIHSLIDNKNIKIDDNKYFCPVISDLYLGKSMISNVTFFCYLTLLISFILHNACISRTSFVTIGTPFPSLLYSKEQKYFI